MSTRKFQITAASIALVAAALTGCATSTPVTPTPTTSVSQSATVAPTDPATPVVTPAPVETTPVVAPVVSGAVLTDAQVAALPDGVKAYALSDGTKVAVVKDQPLPEPVKAEIAAPAQAAVSAQKFAPYTGASGTMAPWDAAAREASVATRAVFDLGKRAVVVYKVATFTEDAPGQYFWSWQSTTAGGGSIQRDKATRVAEMQAYIAKMDDPAQWELIVLE